MESRELLVIDDEESIHQILAQYLRGLGYEPLSAYNGQDGLSLLLDHPSVEVVLTDVRIPGMDGLEVLRQIKQHRPTIQVILMTAYSDKDIAVRSLRLGADDYLEKPFHLDDLRETLERSFSRLRIRSLTSRWHQFLERLPMGFLWCSADGTVEGVTPAAESHLGTAPRSLIGQRLWEIRGLESMRTHFLPDEAEQTAESVEFEVSGKWLNLQRVESFGDPGRQMSTFVITDITEQKSLEQELRSLTNDFEASVERRTRSLSSELDFSQRLLDTAGVLIAFLDHEGRLVRLNKFAEQITKFSRKEAERVFSSFVRHPESALSRVFDPRSTEELFGLIAELPTRDGSMRMVSWSTRLLPTEFGRTGRLIVGIDVTEQQQLEAKLQSYNDLLENMVESRSRELVMKDAQLFHTARLASLGEVAAGIAHELKQPLNVISITADLIRLLHRNGSLSDELLQSNLDKIRRTVERMTTTINHLRGFTRIDSTHFKPLHIEDAVDGALSILGEQIRLDDIDVVREIPGGLPSFLGELNQVEQILVNLLQNARDAIEQKRRQSEVANGVAVEPPKLYVRAGLADDRRNIFVEVADTGVGMTDDVRDRLFEPFFTTKEADRGTGLGLSITMNIVQSHGGTIEVETEPGVGSTFRVFLPTFSG